jgi:hypothetical protein
MDFSELTSAYKANGYFVEITPGMFADSNTSSTFDGYLVTIKNSKGDFRSMKITSSVPKSDFKELIDSTITGTEI